MSDDFQEKKMDFQAEKMQARWPCALWASAGDSMHRVVSGARAGRCWPDLSGGRPIDHEAECHNRKIPRDPHSGSGETDDKFGAAEKVLKKRVCLT